jgi:hypothetical protein
MPKRAKHQSLLECQVRVIFPLNLLTSPAGLPEELEKLPGKYAHKIKTLTNDLDADQILRRFTTKDIFISATRTKSVNPFNSLIFFSRLSSALLLILG